MLGQLSARTGWKDSFEEALPVFSIYNLEGGLPSAQTGNSRSESLWAGASAG